MRRHEILFPLSQPDLHRQRPRHPAGLCSAFAQSAPPAPVDATIASTTTAATGAPTTSTNGPTPGAQEEAPTKEKKEKLRSVYVSFSPLLLVLPVFEVTAEVRVHPKIGVAVLGGIGSIDPHKFGGLPDTIQSNRWTVWEVGAQGAFYALGNFDSGLRLGAQVQFAGISGNAQQGNVSATAFGNGLSLGAFLGGKHTFAPGFALHGDLGVQALFAQADASATDGTTTATGSKNDARVAALLHLNLGWAF